MPDRPRLTFRNGGWVLCVAGLIGLAFLYTIVAARARAPQRQPFDLSGAIVPKHLIQPTGLGRDQIVAIDQPALIDVDAVKEQYSGRRKYLVSSDRVIGVELGTQTRAYPVRVLAWHEVINDRIGDREIAVSYCALTDSTVVFDRTVDGKLLQFGVSGLLLNSNLLLFDRQTDSLWSQLQRSAVAGPSAGRSLTTIPFTLTSWRDWSTRHPHTLVPEPAEEMLSRYGSEPYLTYFTSDRLKFPVEPLPPKGARGWKTPVRIVKDGAELRVCEVSTPQECEGLEIVAESFWFGWYAATKIATSSSSAP